jgi:glycosyltransferase involved in cell wall biosynthesis
MSATDVKIVLLTMVKNEEKNLRRLFSSVASWIDGIVLCDTGSTDGTVDLAKCLLEEMKLPGRIYQFPWENFGKSRTNSFQCFQAWVQKFTGWNPTKVFGLLLDGDMILPNEDGLHAALGALNSAYGGVNLQQKNGGIIYYNTRLLRSSDYWRCVGSTHEYWECEGKAVENVNKPIIVDIGDGGCKGDKFTRDAALLEADLLTDPTNVRTYFYLGQTYMSTGQQEKAIQTLGKRINMGGWDEERYMAHLYRGDCMKTLGRALESVDEWLKAWQLRPHRTEAAMRLITHYRQMPNMNFIAYMYIEKLFQIQFGETVEGSKQWKPLENNDILFVSHTDMRYSIWEELGIVAFYVKRLESAQFRLDKRIISAENTFTERNRLLDLYFWYKWQIPVVQRIRLNIDATEGLPWLKEGIWCPFNPTIRKEEDRYTVNLRHANYQTPDANVYTYRTHHGHIITKNVIADFGANFQILIDRRAPMELVIPDRYIINRETNIHGIEDCRWLGSSSLIGTTRQFHSSSMNRMIRVDVNYAEQAVVRLKPLSAPIPREDGDCQKNWLPFIRKGVECFVYRINPFIVFTMGGEKLLEWKPTGEITFDGLRGSAAPTPWKSAEYPLEEWLMVAHFSYYAGGSGSGGGRKYYHRFITLGADLVPSRISKIFCIGDAHVQYVSGMCESLTSGNYVVTMGVNDSEAWAVEIAGTVIENALYQKVI